MLTHQFGCPRLLVTANVSIPLRTSLVRLALSGLLLAGAIDAAVQGRRSRSGPPYVRTDETNIQYEINDQTRPGLQNTQGEQIITASSTPVEAIQAAMASWSSIPNSRLRFAELTPTDFAGVLRDGRSVISFADTASTRSATGAAIAITFLFSTSAGTLTDTDIIFNPTLPFSTNQEEGTFDIESTIAHEFGHAIGLDHSPVVGATMFASASRGSNRGADLSSDDRVFATAVYPSLESPDTGTIGGSITTAQGTVVPATLVMAIDPNQNLAFGGVTGTGGAYSIRGLPPGSYNVLAEPLNSPVDQGEIAVLSGQIAQPFPTVTAGGFATPTLVTIAQGTAATVDLVVDPTVEPTLNVEGGGAAPAGIRVLGLTVAEVEQGGDFDIELFGAGLDSVPLDVASITTWGTGLSPLPQTISRTTVRLSDGGTFPGILFRVRVSPEAPIGLATLLVSNATETAAYSGGVLIRPTRLTPSFSGGSLVSAASFLTGPLVPGSIHTVFGRNFGPADGALTGLNPVSGNLAAMTSGLTIEIDGVAAPLFFTNSQQINFQAPSELANTSTVAVRRNGRASAAELVPTTDAQPELFQHPRGRRAVAVNQDGSLNDITQPAPKGSFVTLYATGHGSVTPAIATGQPAPTDGTLHHAAGSVECTIDGRLANVAFAGLAPGFVGLLQLNVQIPEETTTADAVPISVAVGGRSSQSPSTLSVH